MNSDRFSALPILGALLNTSIAFVLFGCSCDALTAADLTGTGYIDVTASSGSGAANYVPTSNVTDPRFLWYPGKQALLFGQSSSSWNSSNVGIGSFTGGSSAIASGTSAFAFGGANVYGATSASGDYSVAFGGVAMGDDTITIGRNSSASETGSVAVGLGAEAGDGEYKVIIGAYAGSDGEYSVAIGYEAFAGAHAVGIGEATLADSQGTAVGAGAWALGYSVSLGNGASGSGDSDTTIGVDAEVSADQSTGVGTGIYILSKGSVAVGRYNNYHRRDGATPSPTTPSNYDAIFVVGSGTGLSARSNAFMVYRDGVVAAKSVRIPQSGNISMGSYTAGRPPAP